MAARVLAYHAAPAPCLARAGARARHGHAPRPADLAAWVPRHAGISRRRNSMLALCPELALEGSALRAVFVDDDVFECIDPAVAALPGLMRVLFRRGAA